MTTENNILLWLDDVRNPNIATWLMSYAPSYQYEGEVIWVKTYEEFVEWIEKNGLPTKIAFDNDLGTLKEGYDCAKWLVEHCMDTKLPLPQWTVQSANPVARDNINYLLNNYQTHFELE